MKIIYTKHALARISKRRLSQTSIADTIFHPDKRYSLSGEESKFIKQQGSRLYHVVATYLPKEQAWLVVSAWIRGEEDQPDLLWRLISAPFRFLWWLLQTIFKLLFHPH